VKFHQKKEKHFSQPPWQKMERVDRYPCLGFFLKKKINKMFFGGHAIAGLTSQEKLQTNRWLLQSWYPSYQDDFTSSS
jgi:hypothetical protein